MRTDSEIHVAESKRTNLRVAQSRLSRHEQQDAVSLSDPRCRVGRGDERGGLLFGKELDDPTLMALGRDRASRVSR